MRIRVRGKPEKISLSLCRQAARWYAKRLLGLRLYKTISLVLHFDSKQTSGVYYGFCEPVDFGARKKDFIITLKPSLREKDMLIFLAHEMVHLKQYAKGELTDYIRTRGVIKYNKRIYKEDKIDYWDQPWEIEAYGRERGLYVRFKEELKLNKMLKKKERQYIINTIEPK